MSHVNTCFEPMQVEYFEERAAILEFDGGLPRMHAERAAYAEMVLFAAGQCAVAAQYLSVRVKYKTLSE